MQPIPDDILRQFNAVLEQKAVPSSLRDDYRKWLRYYLDFCSKYPVPDSQSERVRLFIEGGPEPAGFLTFSAFHDPSESSCRTGCLYSKIEYPSFDNQTISSLHSGSRHKRSPNPPF
jgi:hypothetical protein